MAPFFILLACTHFKTKQKLTGPANLPTIHSSKRTENSPIRTDPVVSRTSTHFQNKQNKTKVNGQISLLYIHSFSKRNKSLPQQRFSRTDLNAVRITCLHAFSASDTNVWTVSDLIHSRRNLAPWHSAQRMGSRKKLGPSAFARTCQKLRLNPYKKVTTS